MMQLRGANVSLQEELAGARERIRALEGEVQQEARDIESIKAQDSREIQALHAQVDKLQSAMSSLKLEDAGQIAVLMPAEAPDARSAAATSSWPLWTARWSELDLEPSASSSTASASQPAAK